MATSLDILKPKPWTPRKQAWTSEIAKEIEHLSQRLVNTAAARKWDDPVFLYISPDYRADFEHSQGVPLHTWQDYVAHHERLASGNPDYHFEALDSVADVYEKTGNGAVYLLLRVTGHPRNMVRESIIVMNWKRTNDKWICTGQNVIRGMIWTG